MASYILADPSFFSKSAAEQIGLNKEEYNELIINNCKQVYTSI